MSCTTASPNRAISVFLSLALLALIPTPAHAAEAKVVAGVAPLSSSSGHEYQWIGPALASALGMRIHKHHALGALSLRQINAAMRLDRLSAEELLAPEKAKRLGQQLGANILVTGSYEATWPDIRVRITIVNPQRRNKFVMARHEIKGDLNNLAAVEARIAKAVGTALNIKDFHKDAGVGTTNLRAWRSVTLAQEALNWQSLSARAADPNAKLHLPKTAIDECIRLLTEATTLDPAYAETWASLGIAQALAGQKHFKLAQRSLNKANSLGQGHNPTAILGLSFLNMRQGRFDEARQILSTAIAAHPGFLHARGYLAELYNHRGQRREALAAFKAYLSIAPAQPWVMTQIGYTKSRMGDYRGAINDTQRAVELLPDSPALLLQLASRYIDAKNYTGAEDTLLHLAKIYPQLATPYVRLGYVYLMQGKDNLVLPITEKALIQAQKGHNPRDAAYAHLNMVRAYGRLGRFDEALRHLGASKKIGLVSMQELLVDPALKALREDPRFAELMQ